jgi:hypothetical protein
MFGKDCFKCVVAGNKRGLQSTDAALKARDAIAKFRDELLTVDVCDLKIGDVINATSARCGTSRHGKPCRLTIRKIGPVVAQGVGGEGSKACAWLKENSDMPLNEKVAIVDANPTMCDETIGGKLCGLRVSRVFNVTGDKQTISVHVGSTVQRMPTAEEIEKIVAFARTLDGVSVIEE